MQAGDGDDADAEDHGLAGDGDDAENHGDGQDYSQYFNVEERFTCPEEAFTFALQIARRLRFNLVKTSNKTDPNTGIVRHYVQCDRYGTYKSKANPDTPNKKNNLSSKKCDCKFSILIRNGNINTDIFAIKPKHGIHNHSLLSYEDGHRRWSAFTDEEKEYVIAQHEGGVPTKNIIATLRLQRELVHGKGTPIPARKSFYNLTSRSRSASRGSLNHAQYMVEKAVDNNYIYFSKANEENRLTHFFMCHPEAAKLYRAYPHVVLMDSTYKTNQYKLPVVEMVGVSPVGMNFLIAWAMVEDEKEHSYKWVLECLKNLLPPGEDDLPDSIVTDRELGLMKAIGEVFPRANHLLCTFHIYNAVEQRALKVLPDRNMAKTCVYSHFGRVVNATTHEAYIDAWTEFRLIYRHRPSLVQYIEETWIIWSTKWARCYTNNYLHFRNTATSRVESAHAVLKTWMATTTVKCDHMWDKIHLMMEGQQSELRKALSDSKGKQLVNFAGPTARLFSHLAGYVSHLAIRIMVDEYNRGRTLGAGLRRLCGHALQKTHKLPCAHQLHDLVAINRRVDIRTLHRFWRTLVYEEDPVAEYDHRADMEEMFETIRQLDPSTYERVRGTVDRELHPEREDVQEPEVAETRRGRPRNSTTRNQSGVEHARRRVPERARPEPTPGEYQNAPGAPMEGGYLITTVRDFPFRTLLPNWFRPYYQAYFDPAGDGHCGFRCLSHASIGRDSEWLTMRTLIANEVDRTAQPYYHHIYDYGIRLALQRIIWMNGDISCGEDNYMVGEDLFAFASIRTWAICVVSSVRFLGVRTNQGSATYLPLYAPSYVHEPLGVLWLLHNGNHWRRIRVRADAPMPPIHSAWNLVGARDPLTDRFRDYYQDRLDAWMANIAPE